MVNRYRVPWAQRLDELLADGQWHDGLTVVREAEKLITPGVARRRTEGDRVRMTVKAHGEERPRLREMSTSRIIAIGKRATMRSLVTARVRDGAYEIDPRPLPRGSWACGDWKIRDLRTDRMPISVVAARYQTTVPVLRQLIQDADITVEQVGRITYVPTTCLDHVAQLVEEHRVALLDKRRAALQLAAARRGQVTQTHLALSRLASLSRISQHSAARIVDLNPDMPWKREGRKTLLPIEAVEQWNRAVQAWNADRHDRRIRASIQAAETRKRLAAEAERET